MSPTTYLISAVSTPVAWFTAGATLPLGFDAAFGYLFVYDAPTDTARLLGYLLNGNLQLAEASLTDRAPVSGSFGGTVVEPPF